MLFISYECVAGEVGSYCHWLRAFFYYFFLWSHHTNQRLSLGQPASPSSYQLLPPPLTHRKVYHTVSHVNMWAWQPN